MGVTEILKMYARDGIGDELQGVVDEGLYLFVEDPGCTKAQLFRQIQDPSCFILAIEWVSMEAHKTWAASEALPKWRALLADYRDDRTEALGDYGLVAERI